MADSATATQVSGWIHVIVAITLVAALSVPGVSGAATDDLSTDADALAIPGGNGVLAFGTRGFGGSGEGQGIHFADPTTVDHDVVLNRSNYEFAISFSPDGNQFLYMNGKNGVNSLRVRNIDGTDDHQVVPASSYPVEAEWSADDYIYFVRWPEALYRVDSDGYNKTTIYEGAVLEFTLSPDGSQIAAVVVGPGGWGLHTMDSSGSGLEEVYIPPGSSYLFDGMSWSPDGSLIAFSMSVDRAIAQPPWWDCGWNPTQRDIFTIEPDGDNLTNLSDTDGSPGYINETQPIFSPDGNKITYVKSGPVQCNNGTLSNQATNLYVANTDFTGASAITAFPDDPFHWGIVSGATPAWQTCVAGVTVDCSYPILQAVCAGQAATIVGTSGDDDLMGTSGDDVIVGKEGDDIIDGKGGDDLICGQSGDDVIEGGSGADEIYGDGGADELRGNGGNDVIFGGSGKDKIVGGGDDDNLWGNSGYDRIFGSSGHDNLWGQKGNDKLWGKSGSDTLRGGSKDDLLEGGSGIDYLYGNAGDDQLRGGTDYDECYGGTGNGDVHLGGCQHIQGIP